MLFCGDVCIVLAKKQDHGWCEGFKLTSGWIHTGRLVDLVYFYVFNVKYEDTGTHPMCVEHLQSKHSHEQDSLQAKNFKT